MGMHKKKFKHQTFLLTANTKELKARLTNEMQPTALAIGLISVNSYHKNNHFQESGKFISPKQFREVEFNFSMGQGVSPIF